MTLQETRWGDHDELYDVDIPTPDPWIREGLDLDRFQRLSDEERMRIIIRVLCGLVAIDEQPAPAAAEEPPPGPTPGPSRALPFLGLERERHARTRPKGWNTALLPTLGQERPF